MEIIKRSETGNFSVKKVLVKELVLRLPNFDKLFEIQIDASKYIIKSVLYQKDKKGKEYPIWYGS